jgi:hypothetical protein
MSITPVGSTSAGGAAKVLLLACERKLCDDGAGACSIKQESAFTVLKRLYSSTAFTATSSLNKFWLICSSPILSCEPSPLLNRFGSKVWLPLDSLWGISC